MKYITAIATCFCVGIGTSASAGTVTVPYTGEFDEATVAGPVDGLPAGDYDTIGGLNDVGLFQLVAGTNVFHGSIVSPDDPADVFLVEVLDGFRLTGASILWGTNLPDNYAYPYPSDYFFQNTSGADAPAWYFEESDPTPEIFTISELWNAPYGEAPELFTAPALDVGAGIYSSTLRDESATCGLGYIPLGSDSWSPECVAALDYTMTFTVERIAPPPGVPLPAGLPLLLTGLGALALRRRQRTGTA